MEEYKVYYNTKFQNDINTFFSTIHDDSKYHNDKENKEILTIQYERLTSKNNHLIFLENDEKENFGIVLFFNVLVDMVIYTHFKTYYAKFRDLTNYPKLIGNCLGMCRFYLHPKEIFRAMNLLKKNPDLYFKFQLKFSIFSEIINKELTNTCNLYLKEIDINKLWNKIENEFPIEKIPIIKSNLLKFDSIILSGQMRQLRKDMNDTLNCLYEELKKEEFLNRNNILKLRNEEKLSHHFEKLLLKNIDVNKLKELLALSKKKINEINNQIAKSKLVIEELVQKIQSLKERQDSIPKIR